MASTFNLIAAGQANKSDKVQLHTDATALPRPDHSIPAILTDDCALDDECTPLHALALSGWQADWLVGGMVTATQKW